MLAELVGKRFLVDTDVLIYATLLEDQHCEVAREVLALRARADTSVFISTQNLAEMYPNLTGPKNAHPDSPELARRKIRSVAQLRGLTILAVTTQTVDQALQLCAAHEIRRQRYFNMQLVASMQGADIQTIATENTRDFDGIPEIRAVNPFAA